MGVNKGDNAGQQPDATQRAGLGGESAAAQATHDNTASPAGIGGRTNKSLLNLNNNLRRAIARSSAGEAVSRYADGFKKILDEQLAGDENPFRVLTLDSQQHMTACSAVILALPIVHEGKKICAMHTMLVESSCGRLPAQQVNIGGQTVEIETVAGDTADDVMTEKVRLVVESSIGPGYDLIDAGFNLIPTELSSDDVPRLHNMLFVASAAVQTTIDNVLGGLEEPFNISWIGSSDRLVAKVDYNPQSLESAAGLPIRSDISVLLTANQQTNSNNLHGSSLDITRVDGYVDLVYSQPPQAGIGQQQMTQHFFPRIVLTNVEGMQNAETMELELLGLISATLLARNTAWAGVFRPRAGGGDAAALRDIGALGLEIPALVGSKDNKGAKIDTQSADFGIDRLFELVTAAIHQEPVYTIHVPEVGDQSWLQLMLLYAAQGHHGANEAIIVAANNLTGNLFSKHFQGGALVSDDQNRIHMGFYNGPDGLPRDIRTIDYLAMLNWVGEKDMSAVIKWCDTFDRTDLPMEIRLRDRYELLRAVVGDGLRLTGYARSITFTPEFILALTNAAAEAGLNISPDRVQDYTGRMPRGNADIGRMAVGGINQNVFQSGSIYGNHRSTMSVPASRWGRGRGGF